MWYALCAIWCLASTMCLWWGVIPLTRGFKALKQTVKLHYREGLFADMMGAYREMLTYIRSAVTRNYSEKCINKILDVVSTSHNLELLQEFYQTTLRALEEAKNEVSPSPGHTTLTAKDEVRPLPWHTTLRALEEAKNEATPRDNRSQTQPQLARGGPPAGASLQFYVGWGKAQLVLRRAWGVCLRVLRRGCGSRRT